MVVPYYRSDIIIQEDLLEELLKIYDCNKITGQLPGSLESSGLSVIKDDGNERRKREIRIYLSTFG